MAEGMPPRARNECVLYENATQRLGLFRWGEDEYSLCITAPSWATNERYLTRAEVLEIIERLTAAMQ